MALLPADYAVLGATLLLTVLGLFRGFSGAFAFVIALVLGGIVTALGWDCGFLMQWLVPVWQRVLAEIILFVAVFGLVRFVVKLTIGKILAQPSDAIFGALLGLFCGGLLVWVASTNPDLRAYSILAQKVHAYVG